MNKTWVIIAALFLVPAVLAQNYTAGQVATKFAGLYVVAANYDPAPITPGDYVNVWLRVENRGDQDAPDVRVTIPDEFPWKVVDARTVDLGRLGPASSAVAQFRLLVDGSAPGGPTPLRVQLQRSGLDTPEVAQLSLNVEQVGVLAVDSVTTGTVAPGEPFPVDVTVKNKASATLRSVRVSLEILHLFEAGSGFATFELPFTPVGTGIERTIDALGPGESQTLHFTLEANPDAENKPYKIPVTIDYIDPNGENQNRGDVVGVIVGAEPELSVAIDSTEISSDVDAGNVVVRFVNYGVNDIKFLNARMQETNEYVVVSSPDVYIGKVDSDDYETAEFRIALTSKADDRIEIPLVMEYRDANNEKYSKGVSLTLVRYTPKQLGTQKSSTFLVVIVIIVLALVGWFVYRRFRRRRAK
ncbi:MAG TPA: hypothetical protein VLJ21_02390 [Candidatus Binatia bacterium]|nr:hypothetical protein [Candidatus Binatia bacterium]